MEPLDVTLCVSTRNAVGELPGCIDSVHSWVSEIVVVDMESSDGTLDMARAYGATVVKVAAAGWAEPGRQSGIEAATRPWILVLDADERAAPGLRDVVARYVVRPELAGVWLPRQNFQFGWWVPSSGIWPDWQLRLFRAEKTYWPGDRTHAGPRVDGRCERAPTHPENAIIHHSFPTIGETLRKTDRYTDLEVDRYVRTGVRPTLPRLLLVPFARFLDLYVAHRGYRGGRYGLSLALLSWLYWLIAELKLWERTLSADVLPPGSVPKEDDHLSARTTA